MRLRESHLSFPWCTDGFPFWFPPFLAPSHPVHVFPLVYTEANVFFCNIWCAEGKPPQPHTVLENGFTLSDPPSPRLLRRPFGCSHKSSFFLFILFMPHRPRTPLHSLSTYTLLNCHSFTHRARYIVVCFLIRFTDDSHQPPPNPTLICHTSIRHWSLSRASPPLPWPAS